MKHNVQFAKLRKLVILLLCAATLHAADARVSWDASTSPGVTVYRIHRSTMAGGPYAMIGSVAGDALQYIDAGLPDDGRVYYYVVTASDGATESPYSNEAAFQTPAPPPPPQPPLQISGVTATLPKFGQAAIRWTTDRAATSQVEYGPTAALGSSTPVDQVLVGSHLVTLRSLGRRRTYYFRAVSRTSGGVTATSPIQSFVTR